MNYRYAAAAIVCLFVLSACAPMRPQLQELSLPPERLVQRGYSFIPLNEKGWLIAGRNEFQLALVKQGANPDETFAIQAMPFKLPEFKTPEEFVRLIKEGQSKDTNPQRFSIIKHDVAAYPRKDSSCTKSVMVVEDNAAVKRTEKSGNMILSALTLTCAHPKNKSVGVNIVYSHRYYPDQEDAAFTEKATGIIDTVEFSDL